MFEYERLGKVSKQQRFRFRRTCYAVGQVLRKNIFSNLKNIFGKFYQSTSRRTELSYKYTPYKYTPKHKK